MLGSPIAHSRSPQLHRAAYAALGLVGWTYERIECSADALPGLVDGLGPEWVGLSVTMPGKVAALEFADDRAERAVLAESANTLVRTATGWRADCTDVDGVRGALGDGGVTDLSGAQAVVVGAGGTARPALIALADLGAAGVTIVARNAERARSSLELAERLGMTARVVDFDPDDVAKVASAADAVVSTVPAPAAEAVATALATAPAVLDAIYDPWPTPLAQACEASGATVISGLRMLLNQAFGQVEQFTGSPAPKAEMEAALAAI